MEKRRSPSISRSIILSFCLLISIFLLFGLFIIYDVHTVTGLTTTIYNHPLVVSNAALQSNVSITKMHRNMKDVVLFKSPERIQHSIEAVNEEEKHVYGNLDIVRARILGEEGQALETLARDLFDKWRPIREEVIGLIQRNQREEAAEITRGKGANHVALLEEKMLGLTKYARQKASDFMHQAQRAQSRLNVIAILFLLLGILTSLMVAFLTIKRTASAEKQIQESEERHRSLIEAQTDLVCRFAPDGTFIFVNDVYCRFFDEPREKLIGSRWQPLPVHEDLRLVEEKLSTLSPSNPTVVIENRVLSGKGNVHWIQFVNRGFFDDDGNLIEIQSVGRDITERRQAEEKVEASRSFLDTVVDRSPFSMWISDEKGTVIRTNRSLREALNLTDDKIIGKYNVLKDLNLEIRGVMPMVRAVFEKKTHARFSIPWNVADAGDVDFRGARDLYIDVSMFPILDARGQLTNVVCQWVNVTDQKEAEKGLRESEEHLRAIFEAADTVAFVTTDFGGEDTRVLGFSPGAEKIFGYTAEEILSQRVAVLHPPNAAEDFPMIHQALREGKNWHVGETSLVRKSGEHFPALFTIHPLLDGSGSLIGTVGVTVDLSEKMKLEEQLRQAQKMESIGRLAGGVAHDYNNALSVIIGFTELAMDDVDPTGRLHANLGEILKAAKRATDITRQLLAFARKQTIAPKKLDLNENVEIMLKMLRRLIGEDIDLTWLPGKGLWPVKMDPSQIDQILANLCVNARDAIAGVGNVTIETENVAFDEAYCADHPGFVPGEFVILATSDNGCGMEKEILDNIFDPFFTTKDVDKGTGLGLATVYGIVKQNNGFINIYSEPGKGTTIKIYLSRHMGDAVEIQTDSRAEIPPGGGQTILLVEDDLSILKLAREILRGLGYAVLTAGTPKEAMGLAEEHAGLIHLLMTDVVMPEMNGRELAERLQSLYPNLKCMFMSGYTANVIAHHGVLDEGVHFIQKPFSRRDLATTVKEALVDPNIA